MSLPKLPRSTVALLLLALAGVLSGCGGSVTEPVSPVTPPPVTPPPPVIYTGLSFTASVLAGSKPIVGATLSLYAAGTSGNGSAATDLVNSAINTDATGSATIPAAYDCPSSSSMLYLISRGGTVTGSSSPNNSAVLMTTVGACGAVTSSTHVTLNEATTVASVQALAPFYSPLNGFGASATNTTGFTNAFTTAATLADPLTGVTPGPTLPSNAVSPAPRINSLANLVNACLVNASSCDTFFSSVANGGTAPSNTLDALYELARSPATNAASLYTASQASSAYAPTLTAVPTDWTPFIVYSGGGLDTPSGLGVDSTGSVWVTNYFNVASKFSPIGTPIFPSGITGSGLDESFGLAIDPSDNVWIPNEQPFTSVGIGSVSVFTSAGVSAAGTSGYLAGGLSYPLSIAIDPNGTAWVVDYGNSHVTLLDKNGNPLSGPTGYTSNYFAFPDVVAIDGNHFGWVGSLSDSSVTRVSPDGTGFVNYDCCQSASGIAVDQSNNVWIANYSGASVSMISSAGVIVSKLAYTGLGSLDRPQGIAVDGSGNIWVANYGKPYLTELAGASSSVPGASLTPATGLGADAHQISAYALAIDASGNLWVSNQGSDTITKFIGLATPVKTPLSGLPALP